ncbi:MAG: prolyl oligopeptidase family serine peptidase, partial [Bacteroidota bacterium]
MSEMAEAVQNPFDINYQLPPKEIAELIDAPPTPAASLSPSGKWMLLLDRPNLPPLSAIAEDELRLAGIRINPKTNGPSRASHFTSMTLKSVADLKEYPVEGLPEQARMQSVSWSPDGSRLLFTHTLEDGIELWMVDIAAATARQLTGPIINNSMGGLPYRWFPDSRTIFYKAIPNDRGAAPTPPNVPNGPIVQENDGAAAPVRTFQDLLKNKFDESLFDYYTTAQLIKRDLISDDEAPFGQPGIFSGVAPCPSGQYILISELVKPYSYQVPYSRFPLDIRIATREAHTVKMLAHIPLSENIPVGFGATRTGPRNFNWRSDQPATIYWVEAQDGGDPKQEAEVRDQLYYLAAPFDGKTQESIRFQLRFGGIDWGSDNLAICYEWWWKNRQEVTYRWQPGNPEAGKVVLFDRSWEDRYNAPGRFEMKRNAFSRMVLMTANDEQTLFLSGTGASPEGNRPFVDRFELTDKSTTRLWQSAAPFFEYPIEILNEQTGLMLTRKESRTEPPNYYLRNLPLNEQVQENQDSASALKQLTFFPDPYPQLGKIKKELIQYQRADGVELTGELYLPPDYDKEKDGKLPVLMWAYPREYKSADAAGQIQNSPYEFLRLFYGSPVYFVTQGYAVLDDFSMPIIGEGDDEPNETFIQQLVSGAEAAIHKLDEMGVGDPKRVAVGGHSYGAFMTANLLAHSDLFAAGIARSGAYNRTLTPFGYSFWIS